MEQTPDTNDQLILLTGASGYVGGRLLTELERRGHCVRCLVRRPEFISHRISPSTELTKGDVFDAESLRGAMAGVHTAYFLVHSLAARGSFEENDRIAATNFARAAEQANVQRMIYLGGLGSGRSLSPHLSSRQEVGAILRQSTVPTIEFRASVILGSGSLSFEMVRALVERLPVMTTPRWVRTRTQPIAIEDIVEYLIQALHIPLQSSTVFEIGCADITSYEGIMREYARQRGLKRLIIPVPWLNPWLSGFWLALVTPLYYKVGRWLIEGVKNETIVHDTRALDIFNVRPRSLREAVQRALANEDREYAETRWADTSPEYLKAGWGGVRYGTRFVYSREINVPYTPDECFKPVQCIGGNTGWYTLNWLWSLRGFIDKLFGGVGSYRGRRNPKCLLPGDTIDFWRVEAVEQGRMLRLFSELKAPGRAWLQIEVKAHAPGSTIRLTSIFDPIGLAGMLYWYVLYPFHVMVFRGMLRGIARTIHINQATKNNAA
jgi:uncharacterized protein YbjT (DUF2867 family)